MPNVKARKLKIVAIHLYVFWLPFVFERSNTRSINLHKRLVLMHVTKIVRGLIGRLCLNVSGSLQVSWACTCHRCVFIS